MGLFSPKHVVVRDDVAKAIKVTRTKAGAKAEQRAMKRDVNVDTTVVTPPPCKCGRRAWPCCVD